MSESNLVKIKDITPEQLATICDHTFVFPSPYYLNECKKNNTSSVQVRAEKFREFLVDIIENPERLPYALCVLPEDVEVTAEYIHQHNFPQIKIASVVGFPDGSLYAPELKLMETSYAVTFGANEIDMVLNYKKFKEREIDYVMHDINLVTNVAHKKGALVKLILETCELTPEEIKAACGLANQTEVDFVKTSTGFGAYGARTEDVEIMRKYFAKGVKISGGVKPHNVHELLHAASGRDDGYIELNPNKIRIGESSLLEGLAKSNY